MALTQPQQSRPFVQVNDHAARHHRSVLKTAIDTRNAEPDAHRVTEPERYATEIRRSSPSPHNKNMPKVRLILLAACMASIALTACTSSGAGSPVTVSDHAQVYRDNSGWRLKVPAGWHVRRFSDTDNGITSTGVQLSNVKLPPPSLIPGYPIQVSNRDLPPRGLGLIIATDPDPKLQRDPIRQPPLPAPGGRYWNVGSALAGAPYIEALWFRTHGKTLIACAKVGPKTTRRDLAALAAIIKSLH